MTLSGIEQKGHFLNFTMSLTNTVFIEFVSNCRQIRVYSSSSRAFETRSGHFFDVLRVYPYITDFSLHSSLSRAKDVLGFELAHSTLPLEQTLVSAAFRISCELC